MIAPSGQRFARLASGSLHQLTDTISTLSEHVLHYYVYLHRRVDTGEIFYVGKGRDGRAWSHRGRNRAWRAIVGDGHFMVEQIAFFYRDKDALAFEKEAIQNLEIFGGLVNLEHTADSPHRRPSPEAVDRATRDSRTPEALARSLECGLLGAAKSEAARLAAIGPTVVAPKREMKNIRARNAKIRKQQAVVS